MKKDCSNIEDCLNEMDMLMNNPKKYDALRNKVYKAYTIHCDPAMIIKKFMKDIFDAEK